MLCPQCHTQSFSIAVTCPDCGFAGDITLLERLSNLNFVLTESKSWGLVRSMLEPIQTRYQKQQREVEITLGLRQPPPDAATVRELRLELAKLTALHNAISQWIAKGWLDSQAGFSLRTDIQTQINHLRTRLEDVPDPDQPISLTKRLMMRWEQLNFVRENIEKLYEAGQINNHNYQLALDQLEAQIADVEIKAGLRQRPKTDESKPSLKPIPKPNIEPAAPLQRSTLSVTADDIPAQPSRPPRPAWTWDRFMDSLLSERTLKAILFLGAMLLFAAAVSWVASNWGEFSQFIQGTFLVSVTAVFFGLGWFVRVKQGLHESGVAISAVASFLVPLDFLVYYLSGGFPPESWPTVWLAGSIVCLGIYLVMTVTLQSEFFGYLVAIAAGSLTVSLLNWLNVPLDWWQIGAMGTALTLAIGSEWCRTAKDDWRVFAAPFGRMALVTAVPVMLVGVGWGYLVGNRPAAFYVALAISWWLGGATIATMTRQYRWRSLVLAAILIFPIAVWLSLDWATISRATFALGWAALTPIYFAIAYRLWQQADDAEFQAYSRMILRVGWLLVILSALWPLTNPQIARFAHLWLALTMVLATWLWQRSRFLWLMSLFLMMAATMWQGSQGAAPPEITLSWSLLAILHVAAAVWLDGRSVSRKRLSVIGSEYTAVLFGAGAVLAGLAILPALLFNDLTLLAYALGNFVGVNGWLAYVAYGRQHPGLQTLLEHPRLQRLPVPTISLFHWLAALAIIPWLSLLWANKESWSQAYLPLAYAILGWGLLLMGLRLRRLHWFYGAPWHVAAHISVVVSLGFGFVFYEQWVMTAVLLSAAAFHFASAWLMPRMRWLGMFVGGLLLPIGWLVGLELIGINEQGLLPLLAVIVLIYMVVAMALEATGHLKRSFMEPLYTAAMLIAGVVVVWGMMNLARFWYDDAALIWVALASVQLGISFLLYAWQYDLEGWGHLGVWAGVIAGGLVIKSLSRGSGRSAVWAALLTIALVLAERGLHRLAATQPKQVGALCRRGWRLYKRPLLTAAWVVSAGTIGMALVRNLLWLGGGITRQTYSIIALSLITGLYTLSAHFYKKERFLWFASVLAIAPWTLLANLRWYWGGRLSVEWYGLSWVVLGLLLLGAGVIGSRGAGEKSPLHLRTSAPLLPPMTIAHLLVPLGLIWGLAFADASSISFGLAVLFYGTAVWIDHHFRDKESPADNRFLFPAAILLPVWAVYMLFWADPNPAMTTTGLLVLAFALPMLALGRWVRRWQPSYQWPLYLVSYGSAVSATVLVLNERPILIGVLLFNTALTVLSTYLFRKREWLVPATLLLPWAAWLILEQINLWQPAYYSWTLMGLGALYLIWTFVLRQADLTEYGQPLLAAMFVTVAVGIFYAQYSREGILIGFTAAAVLWGLTAVWLRQPLVMATVPPLLAFAYWSGVQLLNLPPTFMWLTAWPGIIVLLAVGWLLDEEWGIEPKAGQPKQLGAFPWYRFWLWPVAVWQRLRRWWGMSFHIVVLVSIIPFTLFIMDQYANRWRTGVEVWHLAFVLGLGTAVFTYALFRFRLRGLLLLAWMWLQFTYIATLSWLFPDPSRAAAVALAFMPMTIGTAAMGLLVQKLRRETAPFGGGFRQWWFGWSRPFYAILSINLFISQAMSFDGDVGIIVTLLNAVIIGVLATVWLTDWLVYVPLALGWIASVQYLDWLNLPPLAQPTVLAVLTVLYGIIGYALLYWQRNSEDEFAPFSPLPSSLSLWQRPLRHAAWFLSAITLLRALSLGGGVLISLPFAIFDLPVITSRTLAQANMLVLVFAILGLFYLAAAFVTRRRWLGYGSVWLMLGAWSLWLLYVQQQTQLQLYALPASIYLFGVGWLEWEQGSRNLASWIDRAAILLMFGAAFWQSFVEDWGILYALLMMFEGLALLWLGSVRRLRRLLYAGVGGVITAVVGQLIEPLFNLDTYIFLILGAFLLAMGILIEQRREKVLQFAHELRLKLEDWE